MMALRLKETLEYIANSELVWRTTEREIRGLCAKYADRGADTVSRARWKDAQAIAKGKGYPLSLIKLVAALLHGPQADPERAAAALNEYRQSIGLAPKLGAK